MFTNISQLIELESNPPPLRTAIMHALCRVIWDGEGVGGAQYADGSPQQFLNNGMT